jgi:hypothetical protein
MHPLDYSRPDGISEIRNRDRLDHDLCTSIYSGRRASTRTFSIAALMCNTAATAQLEADPSAPRVIQPKRGVGYRFGFRVERWR